MLVSISVAPFSRETIAATCHARDAGLSVIGLTDAPLGPLARLTAWSGRAIDPGATYLCFRDRRVG